MAEDYLKDEDLFDLDDVQETDPEVDEESEELYQGEVEDVPELPKEEVSTKEVAVKEKADLSVFDSIDLDVSSMPGVSVGEIGTVVSRFPIERVKFSTSKRELISILSRRVVIVKTHYVEDVGSFFCFSGKCCDLDGLPRVKYLLPIVMYDTNKAGKPVSSEVVVKVLSIGKDQYEDIMTINELDGDITEKDLLVTCKDEQYQKISIQSAGDARWKKGKSIVSYVTNFWKENHKYLTMAVGRSLTEGQLKEALGYDTGSPDANDVKFDDIFKD